MVLSQTYPSEQAAHPSRQEHLRARPRRIPRRTDLGRHRGRRRAGVGAGAARRPARARRPHRSPGRPRRPVHLRHADAQLPHRGGHLRPPPRRRARRGARGPVDGHPRDHGRPHRPGHPDGRRRDHRARHQHHADGPRRGVGRLAGLRRRAGRAAEASRPRSSRPPPSPPWSRCRRPPSASPLLFAIGGTADVPFSTVATAMVGVHTVIGIGEAVITAPGRVRASSPSAPTSSTAPDRACARRR